MLIVNYNLFSLFATNIILTSGGRNVFKSPTDKGFGG